MMKAIRFHPIGVIRTPFKKTEGMPIQPHWAGKAKGTIELRPEYAEGLRDLSGFSHVVLLYHLHKAKKAKLLVTPFLDTEKRGVFATRAPCRPNAIGLSIVRLVSIDGATVIVEGIDVLDGTPLLDIKPFVPEFDTVRSVKTGWLGRARRRGARARSDGRFSRRGRSSRRLPSDG